MSRSHDSQRRSLSQTRRNAVKLLASLPLAVVTPWPALARRTPPATAGPFYPTPSMRFTDADNDLVRISGVVEKAGGKVIALKGRVLDSKGAPVENARVEIWQCDVNGRYLHTGDRQRITRDPGFQGFGHVVTGADGAYAFRTILPVAYPGRTPHIHVKVIDDGRELTTQFYIADHRQNAGDFLFQRMSADQQEAVSMIFVDGDDGPETTVDIVL
ncbi:MAG: protocatechuate 3,4-dioxygenase [Alphaproteobacteria bacterium]|nr:protocatechuate 3,4-dioxygenase [Alphaproteobacteria bacterium]